MFLGNTALTYACAGGFVDIVKVLLNEGANIEDHNENGHTPLMEAASAGHVEVARVLLDHGGINGKYEICFPHIFFCLAYGWAF